MASNVISLRIMTSGEISGKMGPLTLLNVPLQVGLRYHLEMGFWHQQHFNETAEELERYIK